METTDTNKPAQFPQFWNEEWLQIAIDELDKRKLTHDERASLEILIARNAEAVKAESRRMKEALDLKDFKTVKNLLLIKLLTVEQIATSVGVSEGFVLSVQQKLSVN